MALVLSFILPFLEMETIKKIGVILVVSLVVVKSLIAPILFVKYQFTKDFIVENFCINKDKPELHCDGQCYLALQIKAVEEQDGKEAQSEFLSYLLSFQVVLNSSNSIFQNTSEMFYFLAKSESSYANPFHSQSLHIEVFHPPKVIQA
ncbi:hypothetical protein SAMN06298216_2946 [Spirosomataceae bacterium TFI 002]|nr:hypothetical protein SAMN06298216_2946 [Spirosomataceae bacterium TFI 002]